MVTPLTGDSWKHSCRDYDHVIVLSYAGLKYRKRMPKRSSRSCTCAISPNEMRPPSPSSAKCLDLRNRELAEVTRVDDFIVSDHLVSLMMSQLSEDADLYAVFTDIFDPEGSEIYMKPVRDYVELGKPVPTTR